MSDPIEFTIAEEAVGFEVAEAQPIGFEIGETAGIDFTTTETVLGFDTVENPLAFEVAPQETIEFVVANLAVGPSPEDVMPPVYATRTDFASTTIAYVGEAIPGTLDSSASWRIKRLTLGLDDDVVTEWAGGNANFDKVWNDRASLSYS